MQARIACGRALEDLKWSHLDEAMNVLAARYDLGNPMRDLLECLGEYMSDEMGEDALGWLDDASKALARVIERAEQPYDWREGEE